MKAGKLKGLDKTYGPDAFTVPGRNTRGALETSHGTEKSIISYVGLPPWSRTGPSDGLLRGIHKIVAATRSKAKRSQEAGRWREALDDYLPKECRQFDLAPCAGIPTGPDPAVRRRPLALPKAPSAGDTRREGTT